MRANCVTYGGHEQLPKLSTSGVPSARASAWSDVGAPSGSDVGAPSRSGRTVTAAGEGADDDAPDEARLGRELPSDFAGERERARQMDAAKRFGFEAAEAHAPDMSPRIARRSACGAARPSLPKAGGGSAQEHRAPQRVDEARPRSRLSFGAAARRQRSPRPSRC